MAERIPPSASEYDHIHGFSNGEAWLISIVVGLGIVMAALLLGFEVFR